MSATDYRRVEQAIRFLEDNFTRQPSLEEVAEYVGLSKFYFQRTFKRWAGVSPKRFLQFLTVEYAKRLLRRSQSVLSTSYEAGLSGPSRLHDLFVTVEAVTPGEFKHRGDGVEIRYGVHASPFGACLIATTDRGICALQFPENGSAIEDLANTWQNADLREDAAFTRPLVERIFEPDVSAPDDPIRLVLQGTNFQLKVWRALLHVPEGALVSYGDIARAVGHPKAGRAVGNAVGHNPVAYLIPCHRVIREGGAFGSYRWGAARKKAMLGWEAARQEMIAAQTASASSRVSNR